jgi:hypothetical protein
LLTGVSEPAIIEDRVFGVSKVVRWRLVKGTSQIRREMCKRE